MQVYQGYGAQNGLVTLTNIRNTIADIMQLGGVPNADRYVMPMSMEREQQMMQQQELLKQAGQFAASPMMDPSKNPEMMQQVDVGSNPAAEVPPEA